MQWTPCEPDSRSAGQETERSLQELTIEPCPEPVASNLSDLNVPMHAMCSAHLDLAPQIVKPLRPPPWAQTFPSRPITARDQGPHSVRVR
jgi:hypothetical protein